MHVRTSNRVYFKISLYFCEDETINIDTDPLKYATFYDCQKFLSLGRYVV